MENKEVYDVIAFTKGALPLLHHLYDCPESYLTVVGIYINALYWLAYHTANQPSLTAGSRGRGLSCRQDKSEWHLTVASPCQVWRCGPFWSVSPPLL